VFNILLQVLDDGRLTDARGRTVDFKNTVLIMTSNIGSQEILDAQQRGQTYEALQALVADEVKRCFRPEFLNRVDETVVFHPLNAEELGRIVDIQLARVRDRLQDRRIRLVVTDEALLNLGRRGYNPMYGARPLKRLIQHDVETPLSKLLVKGDVVDGDTVTVDCKNDQVMIVPTGRH